MAQLNQIKKVKITLPTIEGGYVEAKESLTVADAEAISNLDEKSGNKVAKQLLILLLDWNLEDDKGVKLPLNVENVNKLDVKDMMAIFKELKLDDTERFLGQSPVPAN